MEGSHVVNPSTAATPLCFAFATQPASPGGYCVYLTAASGSLYTLHSARTPTTTLARRCFPIPRRHFEDQQARAWRPRRLHFREHGWHLPPTAAVQASGRLSGPPSDWRWCCRSGYCPGLGQRLPRKVDLLSGTVRMGPLQWNRSRLKCSQPRHERPGQETRYAPLPVSFIPCAEQSSHDLSSRNSEVIHAVRPTSHNGHAQACLAHLWRSGRASTILPTRFGRNSAFVAGRCSTNFVVRRRSNIGNAAS